MSKIVGFRVSIARPTAEAPEGEVIGPKPEIEHDLAWEMWTGGGEATDHCDHPAAMHDNPGGTHSPGKASIGEITLRGAMTDKRGALQTWIDETVQGTQWKRTVTITELLSVDGGVKDGKRYIYSDCFPVAYVFPRLSVSNTTGYAMEEVRIKPNRCELK